MTRPGATRGIARRAVSALTALVLLVALLLLRPWQDRGPEEVASTWRPVPTAELLRADDALHQKVLRDLREFTHWLQVNDAEGHIGEIGIADDGDVDRWNLLAQRWFAQADEAGLWVDVWSVGEWWEDDYDYSPFTSGPDGGPVALSRPQGELLAWQAQNSDEPRGVNVSGAEFGAPGGTDATSAFSNEQSGTYDRDYHYDSSETFAYLASRGIDTVRLPFRWERIQPELGGDLDPAERDRLRHAVSRAHASGLDVVLDVHNFGAYHLSDGSQGVRRAIGSAEVTHGHFADLWRRLSQVFADDPGVVAYDLMNEPVDLPAADGLTPAQQWERASQEAVTAVRDTGDETLILVPGYRWSHVHEWVEQHPRAWIVDPSDNVRYTAHHYWRQDEQRSYDAEVLYAGQQSS